MIRRQLQQAEEQREAVCGELLEARRLHQEALQDRDQQRQEALEQRRLLGDQSREREALHASNQELRTAVKRAESDNNRYHPSDGSSITCLPAPLMTCLCTV